MRSVLPVANRFEECTLFEFFSDCASFVTITLHYLIAILAIPARSIRVLSLRLIDCRLDEQSHSEPHSEKLLDRRCRACLRELLDRS